MSITATVENGIIRIPAGTPFPNGAQVSVELLEQPSSKEARSKAWVQNSIGVADSGLTTDDIMRMTRGEE